MRIGLLGDVHGRTAWFRYAIDKFAREGITTVVQLGDFGIGQPFMFNKTLKSLNQHLVRKGITFYVVPGNHENYDVINALPVEEDGWQHLKSNILLAPRGHRWVWDGVSFVALGGAPSVDRSWRRQRDANKPHDPCWWEAEAITLEDVSNVAAGGYADVMIGHDAPNGISTIQKNISSNPHGFKQVDLLYAAEGRELLTQAFRAVAPKYFFHGHYHFLVDEAVVVERDGEYAQCHVIGLTNDQQNFSLGEFNTDSMTAWAWDIKADYNEYLSPGRAAQYAKLLEERAKAWHGNEDRDSAKYRTSPDAEQ